MKARSVRQDGQERLCVRQFGMEEIGTRAKWGPGTRNVYIFHYVLRGKGYFNHIPVKKNEGFLIRANELTEYHFEKTDPWQYFWVIFEGSLAEDICQKYIETDSHGIFSYPFADSLTEIMAKLFASSESLSQAEGLSAFFYLLSLHEETHRHGTNHHVSDAKNYMYLHMHQPVSVTDVAAALGISDRYLYNLFVKHEGVSPKRYLSELRLTNAKTLLKNSQYSVTEIAASVGFSDVLTFSRFFSKFVGISPTTYRKNQSLPGSVP